MCAHALALSSKAQELLEIRKVFYGCKNPKFGGNGSVYSLHSNKTEGPYESEGGLMEEKAIELLRVFYS